jgi:hypothetical protein
LLIEEFEPRGHVIFQQKTRRSGSLNSPINTLGVMRHP